MNKDQFLFIFIVASLLCVLIHIGNTYNTKYEAKVIEPDTIPTAQTPNKPLQPIPQIK